MNTYEQFKGEKITVMGLGLLGRGINVVKFLHKCGALITVTDLKDEKKLAPALKELKGLKGITYVLGRHRLSEFRNRDMIIKAAGVPLDSKYIEEARNNDIPIEMDASLSVKLFPESVTVIGVTGTKGKSTVTHLIAHLLREAGEKVHVGGNVYGRATLPLTKKAKEGDYVVLELDSWQLQGFGESKISPHIAVFTNFMDDHLNYYGSRRLYFKDKSHIFRHQEEGDFLITSMDGLEAIRKYYKKDLPGTLALARTNLVPESWELPIRGEHMKTNIALVVQLAELLSIRRDVIRSAVESFKGVEGRLQYVKKIRGVAVYNDNNATTPDATLASLKSFDERQAVLIAGGSDKGLDYAALGRTINRHAKSLILLPGSASSKIKKQVHRDVIEVDDLKKAFDRAQEEAEEGDVILFSPGAASFSQFTNEYQRGKMFLELVRSV